MISNVCFELLKTIYFYLDLSFNSYSLLKSIINRVYLIIHFK